MAELDNRVNITVQIQDTVQQLPGFGIKAIVHEHDVTAAGRIATYDDLTSLHSVFPVYTPVGKYASFFFGQEFIPEKVKVIKRESGETVTQALTAAALIDEDWYAVGMPGDVSADHQAAATYVNGATKMYFYTSQEAAAITSADTDIFSVLQATSNDRVAGWFSKKAGVEFVVNSLTVAGTTCTAAVTGTPVVAAGDTVGFWDSATAGLNSTWTVEAVGANDFTFTVPSGTASDATATNAWVNFNLIGAAISGKMLPKDAGSSTWDVQELVGVTPDKLSGTERGFLGTKNANWYTTVGSSAITGGPKPGGGGKTASGRYIDVRRGTDWLTANLQASLLSLIVRSGGELGYDAPGLQKVQTTIESVLNEGLDKGFLTPFVSGQFAGQNYVVQMPSLASIPQADKTNRLLSGITIYALIRGKIHNLEATVTLST